MKLLPCLALVLVASAYLTMVLGSYVTSTASGLGCGSDWPTCGGRVLPDPNDTRMVIEWFHRLAALLDMAVGIPILAIVIGRLRRNPRLVAAALAAAGLLTAQVLLGMVTVKTELQPLYVTAHQGTASAFFGSTIVLAFLSWRAAGGRASAVAPGMEAPRQRRWLGILRDYLQVTKPGIVSLLVLTSVTSLVVAHGPRPPFAVIATLPLAGALAAASGAVFNNYLDRRLDGLMVRTHARPIPAGRLPPRRVIAFATALGVASFLLFWFLVNPLSALLALGGLVFYAVVYTILLKRSTPQNIVIGGAAGCFPALVGWAGATNGLSPWAFVLAAIIFLWTPPHFWALALVHREDYAKARIPMMPVVAGEARTKRQMLAYTVATVAVSLTLLPLGALGALYAVAAAGLGVVFILRALEVLRRPGAAPCLRLFSFSILYILLLFGAMVADRIAFSLI